MSHGFRDELQTTPIHCSTVGISEKDSCNTFDANKISESMPPRVSFGRGRVRGHGHVQAQANPGFWPLNNSIHQKKPPEFSGSFEVAVVKNFSFKLEKIFARIGCTDEEMVSFVTFQLNGEVEHCKQSGVIYARGHILKKNCPRKNKTCFKCGKGGHLASSCLFGYGGSAIRCFKCSRAHDSRNCPMLTGSFFECRKQGHHVVVCPRKGTHGMNRVTNAPPKGPFSTSQGKQDHQKPKTQEMLYATNRRDAQASNDVVTCILPVSLALAYVLFDPGATHSFISITFATKCNMPSEPLDIDVVVDTSIRRCLIGSSFSKSCVIEIEGKNLEANLTLLNLKDFDVILGMDRLAAHYASLDNSRGDLKLEDIHIVKEFPDVFPEDFPRLPPNRDIEFSIELVPGIGPISKAPYRTAPAEPKELKDQLPF
ncbi:hypothetical protein LIER_33081 [Lithospermum erythrorhizon]|uniref:CCHC-type domain-containing protein n=1 Tax=Lithospermum erythrorhizon TaxID=34254 RepID=A0AAV3RVS0_LITER